MTAALTLRHVEQAARAIARAMNGYKVIVDKSTVPVGTGRRGIDLGRGGACRAGVSHEFDVVSNPEFLREGSAVQDFTHPDRVVIGSEQPRASKVMKEVYRALFLNETPYIETGLETAEMIKYAANAFLSVKISFINEVANLCEAVGANVQDVARALGKDGRIGAKYLHAGPGYGGSCFPKDTRALARTGRDFGEPLTLSKRRSRPTIGKNPAWCARSKRVWAESTGKTIAVLGLSFKPNTDDMRDAPAITICEGLAARGARLRVWDPAGMKEAAWRLESIKGQLTFACDEYDALKGADALVILTGVEPIPEPGAGQGEGASESPGTFRPAKYLQTPGCRSPRAYVFRSGTIAGIEMGNMVKQPDDGQWTTIIRAKIGILRFQLQGARSLQIFDVPFCKA